MKILFSIFFIFFSSPIIADNISDFQIEGFSVGDSLLDFYNEVQIINNKANYFPNEREYYVVHSGDLKLEKFDSIEFYLKTGDSKFIIRYFAGFIFYEDGINMSNCENLRNKYSNAVENFLKNPKKIDEGRFSHYYDKSGKSIQSRINFIIEDDYISIECLDWSDDIHKKHMR